MSILHFPSGRPLRPFRTRDYQPFRHPVLLNRQNLYNLHPWPTYYDMDAWRPEFIDHLCAEAIRAFPRHKDQDYEQDRVGLVVCLLRGC